MGLTVLVVLVLLSLQTTLGSFLSHGILLISREKASSTVYRSEPVVFYDEFGDIPQIKNTYAAIARGTSIVAVSSLNHTVLAFLWPNASSLQIPMGAFPFHSLGSPQQFMLVTGLAGDCRKVLGYAKAVALNMTVEYGCAPRGKLIAERVGMFLQEATGGGSRPLACHVLIADGLHSELFDVDIAGNVKQVWASAAGAGGTAGYRHLQEFWTSADIPLSPLEALTRETLDAMLRDTSKKSSEDDRKLEVRLHVVNHRAAE